MYICISKYVSDVSQIQFIHKPLNEIKRQKKKKIKLKYLKKIDEGKYIITILLKCWNLFLNGD